MGQYELTQDEWTRAGFVSRAGTLHNGASGTDCVSRDCPASTMTWYEAVNFSNARSRAEGLEECITLEGCTGTVGTDFVCTGYAQTTASYYDCTGYRLPTTAEFQYAIRAGTTTAFYSGPYEPSGDGCIDIPSLDGAAWYCSDSADRTHPIGQKAANPWGLFDMMGNASEFTASAPDRDTENLPPATDPYAVLELGGNFSYVGGAYVDEPSVLRSAAQISVPPNLSYAESRASGLGFRLVRTISPADAKVW